VKLSLFSLSLNILSLKTMNSEQEAPRSNGKLASILNHEPVVVKSSQESPKNDKETTTIVNGGKASPKIKKFFPTKETSSKNDNSDTSKATNKQAKNSKKTKTDTPPKVKPTNNSRKRPLSPSDSEEGRETSQEPERCRHPKHDEYNKDNIPKVTSVNKRAKLNKSPKLVAMPRRLEGVLNIDRGTKMCSRCINQTDKDPQYTSHKKYISRQTVYKKNERSRLKIDMKGE